MGVIAVGCVCSCWRQPRCCFTCRPCLVLPCCVNWLPLLLLMGSLCTLPAISVPCEMSLHRTCTHLQAVCFLRPTRENIARIRRELRDPRFGEYHLCEWATAGAPAATC